MQSAPEKVTYSIQRADYSITADSLPITLADAQSTLRDHDWQKELNYQRELEAAEKDWCCPNITFVAAAGQFLQIMPSDDGTAECQFWEERRAWGCQGLTSDEQAHIIALFYYGDHAFLVQGWHEFEVEAIKNNQGDVLRRIKLPGEAAAAQRRDEWLEWARGIRASRGFPPELTDEELNLSEDGAYALYVREDSLLKHREETIKGARAGRKWLLIVAAGGAALLGAYYAGWMPDWYEKEGHHKTAILIMVAGLGLAALHHLNERAERLGTKRAQRQLWVAQILAGIAGIAAMVFAVAFIVLLSALWFGLLAEAALRTWLPGIAANLPRLDRAPGDLVVAGIVATAMLLIAGLAFANRYYRRRISLTEALGGAVRVGVGLFAFAAFAPVVAFTPIFAVAMTSLALGYANTDALTSANLGPAFAISMGTMVAGIAATYVFQRGRAHDLEGRGTTLSNAAISVAVAFLIVSFLALVVVAAAAWAIKASMPWLPRTGSIDDPFMVAVAIYVALQVVAAVTLAVLLVKPRWQDRLGTGAWALILILGTLGWIKIVLFGIADLVAWNSTAGAVAIGVAGVAIVIGLLVILARWLRNRLRGPQPIRRIAGDVSFWSGLFAAMLGLDFIEKRYQVPAFWIAMSVGLPIFFVVMWWRDRRDRQAHR